MKECACDYSARSDGYLVDGPINGENVITSGAPENLKDGENNRVVRKGQSS